MPWSLVEWDESVDQATIDNIAAGPDPILTTSGDNLTSPGSRLYGAYANGTSLTRARLTSPTLRKKALLELAPVDRAAEPSSPAPFHDFFDKPVLMAEGEVVNAQAAEDGMGATIMRVGAWIGSALDPLPTGDIFSTRATGTTTLGTEGWTNVTLTYDTSIEVGYYAVAGMRAEAAGAIFARLVFPKLSHRPGVVAFDAAGDLDVERFRAGRAGMWGWFHSNQLPTVDFFSLSADTAETVWLDLVGPIPAPAGAAAT